ncbi:MAG: hypothetical protein J3Q66DRAFT_405100 [Benniella sp.]|nr:MAG: hypothetical protein J3Q66DRAFT_405100 [Benniella sp.]
MKVVELRKLQRRLPRQQQAGSSTFIQQAQVGIIGNYTMTAVITPAEVNKASKSHEKVGNRRFSLFTEMPNSIREQDWHPLHTTFKGYFYKKARALGYTIVSTDEYKTSTVCPRCDSDIVKPTMRSCLYVDPQYDDWDDEDMDTESDWVYKAVRDKKAESAWQDCPCGVCPVAEFCTENGPINPAGCVYYSKWLEF